MRRSPRVLRVAAAVAALVVAGGTADASEVPVDLELVLAVDVSYSMDLDELHLQRRGYVSAFRHPDVVAAIRSGGWGRIAVTYLEWAGAGTAVVLTPWTLIDGVETAAGFAMRLGQAEIRRMHRTSISDVVVRASGLFRGNGFRGARRVIDVSGDGPNNHGPPVAGARDAVIRDGITINGLPILLKAGERPFWYDLEKLDTYYEDCVIGGFGAFIVRVRRAEEFAAAIRRKLILEIASARPRLVPVQLAQPASPVDCLIGEKLWDKWIGDATP